MKPELVVNKTCLKAITLKRILFFWLIIPLIIMIVDIILLKKERIEFYEDKIISKSGLINTKERMSSFVGVNSVSITQSLWGKIFNYGDVQVDTVGKWDINTKGVSKPKELKEYLESKMIRKTDVNVIAA